MRKTILKWLTLTLLLCYVGWVAVWAGAEDAQRPVRGVEICAAGGAPADSLVHSGVAARLSHYGGKLTGVPPSQVDVEAVEDYLRALSNFESVECMLTAEHVLRIDVVPMVPELRIFDSTGSYYINREGKRIDSNARFFADVPVVRGEFGPDFPATSVLPLTRHIASDAFLRELVSMVEARDADNLLLVPRLHGHIVNFGDTTRLADKTQALLAMYRKVMPYKGWDTYDTISVKFRGQVVATRRDKQRAVHSSEYDEEVDPEEATLPEAEDATAGTTNPPARQ